MRDLKNAFILYLIQSCQRLKSYIKQQKDRGHSAFWITSSTQKHNIIFIIIIIVVVIGNCSTIITTILSIITRKRYSATVELQHVTEACMEK